MADTLKLYFLGFDKEETNWKINIYCRRIMDSDKGEKFHSNVDI